MKKEEKIKEIRKRADEYARSGRHYSWLTIEMQIRSEGLEEARRVLDNKRIRDELDALCKIATSPEEVDRRNYFDFWLDKTSEDAFLNLADTYPKVKFSVRERTLFIYRPTYAFEIRRKFGSNELEFSRVWEEPDGQRWRSYTPERIPDSNFEEITGTKAVELIKELIRRGEARTKQHENDQ